MTYNREIMRMNLTGMRPDLVQRIKEACEEIIRGFDGSPEQVQGFSDARDLWELIEEVTSGV